MRTYTMVTTDLVRAVASSLHHRREDDERDGVDGDPARINATNTRPTVTRIRRSGRVSAASAPSVRFRG